VLIAAMLFVAQRPTAAASTVLTIFTGVVQVARGGADFAAASNGAVLAGSDRVRTDDAGHALITFFDGSTLELEPSTTVQVDAASPNADGSISVAIGQTLGRTWASVQKLTRADSKFEVKTPTSTATVRGTGFLTEVLPSGETTVETTDGTVAVSAQGQTVLVTQGQQTTIRPGQAPTPPASTPAPSTTLRFGMHSPAYLVVVDPLGRSCGVASLGSGAALLRHVPRCIASSPGSEPQLIDLPDAIPGTYRLVIVSIEPGGPFTLTATGVDDRGSVSFDLALPGGGQPGATFGSTLDVHIGADGRLIASALGSLVSLQGPPPSPSAAPSPASSAPTTVVPSLALPTLAALTATPTVAASATPVVAASRPALRTPMPEPTFTATPTPTASSAPTPTPEQPTSRPVLRTLPPEPIFTATPTPSPAPRPTATPSPSPAASPVTPSPSRSPMPGCTPSSNQPRKCEPG
jgi:FecR protein